MSTRNYNINQNEDTFKSFARNYITQEAKELILSRAYAASYFTPSAINSANSLIEGVTNLPHSLYNLPLWDIIILRYEPTGLFCILPIALVTVHQNKNIEKTPIAGADGTVKEFISAGDSSITIKATIIGNGIDYYPKEDVQSIQAVLNVGAAITIENKILNKYMGINNVIVTDFEFSQKEEGMRNVQTLSLELITDNPDIYRIILNY